MTDAFPLLDAPALSDGRAAYVKFAGQYATALGKSRQTAKNWNDAGLIVWVRCPATGTKLVDVAASDRARHDHQNPLKRDTPALAAPAAPLAVGKSGGVAADLFPAQEGRDSPTAAPRPAAPAVAPNEDDSADEPALDPRDPLQVSVAEDKARIQRLKRFQEEREWQEQIGMLVPADLARQREAARMAELRKAIMRIPRAAADKANPEDPARARSAIEAALREILAEFIAEGRAALKEERAQVQKPAHA
ncbi:hypothetical protein FKB34_01860 [Glycocaulis profundi]|nr:hypothetical protein FKB34_01860 [Glycocaulis profundi]